MEEARGRIGFVGLLVLAMACGHATPRGGGQIAIEQWNVEHCAPENERNATIRIQAKSGTRITFSSVLQPELQRVVDTDGGGQGEVELPEGKWRLRLSRADGLASEEEIEISRGNCYLLVVKASAAADAGSSHRPVARLQ